MIKALALTGPTASGKTALSLKIAKALDCEILSCDSMQIYRGMDVGTAKATAAERATVPHHLIDLVSPADSYSASDYAADALRVAREVEARGKLPLFVGGTGLYLDTLTRGAPLETPESTKETRARFDKIGEAEGGVDRLYAMLSEVDPESAAATHKNNVRRVIRALEIYETTGIPKSEWDRRSRESAPRLLVAHLSLDVHNRETLYRRADARVDEMLRMGLADEVRSLLDSGYLTPETTAAQAIGYKEMIAAVRGDLTTTEAADLIRLATRHYVKRQLTWFRHSGATPLYLDTEDGRLRDPEDLLSETLAFYRASLSES